MTDKQPEALSIAKRLKTQQQPCSLALRHKAAGELRRLHEVNAELVEALEKLARLGNEPMYGNSIGNTIAQEALQRLNKAAEDNGEPL